MTVQEIETEIKLAITHLKLVEIIKALEPGPRNKRLRNGFRKVQTEAESLSDMTSALDKISDDLLRDIYRIIDLLTVELASTSMIAEAIGEVDEPTSVKTLPQPQHQTEQTPVPR